MALLCISCDSSEKTSMRKVITLKKGWKFKKGSFPDASKVNFDDSNWQDITVPHDWAIYGPFDKEIDKQTIAITQNNEVIATEKTGRTGALPYIGEGWYRTNFSIADFDNNKTKMQFELLR